MNTTLVVRTREALEEIKTDQLYTDVFPRGILNAGLEILSNPDMATMAKRSIFQLGIYQGRADFVLNDLYRELDLLDMRYRIDSGNIEGYDSVLTEDELQSVRHLLSDLQESSDSSFFHDEDLWDAIQMIYMKSKKNIDLGLQADSMLSVCKIALQLGYRIIMEDSDLTPSGGGIFKDIFETDSPEEDKSTAVVSSGLSFKVILNDAQTNLYQNDPIIDRMKLVFPEAESISLKVYRGGRAI